MCLGRVSARKRMSRKEREKTKEETTMEIVHHFSFLSSPLSREHKLLRLNKPCSTNDDLLWHTCCAGTRTIGNGPGDLCISSIVASLMPVLINTVKPGRKEERRKNKARRPGLLGTMRSLCMWDLRSNTRYVRVFVCVYVCMFVWMHVCMVCMIDCVYFVKDCIVCLVPSSFSVLLPSLSLLSCLAA